jgi:hypothetical protein
MRDPRVYNRYYEAPRNIRILPHFDPRPVRRGEWRPYHEDMLQRYVNWPIIDPEHLSFASQTSTRVVLANFIAKYASSPDPSLKKTVHSLRILSTLLTDNTITIDSHMDELNFDPNEPLPPYTDTRLYMRVVNYGSGAVSIFESWATEHFLMGMKQLFQPINVMNRTRAEHMREFNKFCLKEKAQAQKSKHEKPPSKRTKLP